VFREDGSHSIDGSNKFMSFASFGASNPEEYRLREDFLRYSSAGGWTKQQRTASLV
jgi:hypothetical protein